MIVETLPLTKKMAGKFRLVKVMAEAGIFLDMGRRMIYHGEGHM